MRQNSSFPINLNFPIKDGTLSRLSWLHLQSLAPTNPHWVRTPYV
jgi:hypothetical protein